MSLKYEVANLDGVPDALKALYVPKDGKFVLDVEGVAPAALLAETNGKLVEFRDTNVKLLKALGVATPDEGLQRAALIAGIDPTKLARLKAVDPDEYEALKARVAKLKDKGMDDPDAADARIKAMIDSAVSPLKTELATEKAGRAEAQGRADKALMRQVVGDKFTKAGGRQSALDFIVAQAESTFRVADNAVKALDGKFSTAKPGNALELDEWLTGVAKDYDFAFEPSKGGGANPRGGVSTGQSSGNGTFKTTGGAEVKTDGITILQ